MAPSPEGTFLQPRGAAPLPLTAECLAAHLGDQTWLVVVPHDDDLVLGSGILLTLAASLGVQVHVAVCTDGSLGYTRPEDFEHLARTRRREMAAAVAALSLDPAHLHWLDFPDGSLANRLGARATPEAMGLGQALARLMRVLEPRVVMSCHERDVHPDHRAVAWDTSIACFWASSDIWRDLGEPIALPRHVLYGVYAGFEGAPDLRVVGDAASQERKLRALACFESQGVIREIVEKIRAEGPVEHFQYATQRPHDAREYADSFGPLPPGGSQAVRFR